MLKAIETTVVTLLLTFVLAALWTMAMGLAVAGSSNLLAQYAGCAVWAAGCIWLAVEAVRWAKRYYAR